MFLKREIGRGNRRWAVALPALWTGFTSGREDMLDMQQTIAVRKRDGRVVGFEAGLIQTAIEKAFLADAGVETSTPVDPELGEEIRRILDAVVEEVLPEVRRGGDAAGGSESGSIDVESIQDCVERQLMRNGHYAVARRYIVYREEHARVRTLQRQEAGLEGVDDAVPFHVDRGGHKEALDVSRLRASLFHACRGLEAECDPEKLLQEVQRQLYDGITPEEIARALILAARSRIERDPSYDTVAGRLILAVMYREALGRAATGEDLVALYRERFAPFVEEGIAAERLDPKLREFDLARLADALLPDRDGLFPYLGLQTVYDRYLLHIGPRRIEAPQFFFMRVAMGLALREGGDKNDRAIEFYETLSSLRFMSATPTLFNSGTCHPQLSSCYLTTVMDDLDHIFKSVSDNAKLSKWAGGLGNDWTNIRATNAYIQGTNGQSQGIIPFLKVVNDTAVAVNQGGKRKGAVCAYLETWHLDLEEFLDLRKNTGDDRRRAHDMHTAHWIPDLFMKRVESGGEWTLFSPDEVPDLHDLYGQAFERAYEEYERKADAGEMKLFRRVPAMDLWRKMLTRLFETGHPWITFKDPSNVRSPQDHTGVVHSSNLCTEILLNTSEDETAVCNLGSINLGRHMKDGELDLEQLESTVNTAVRMLDNVIDINYYPTPEARRANQRHRPIGLGLMGFQDALVAAGIPFASDEAVEFADRSMEAISHFAIRRSSELAKERGPYPSYEGSKWDRGLLPIDTIAELDRERGVTVDMNRDESMDWAPVREHVKAHGMRNSNVMAIAPTATISTIVGASQSIEPMYKHLFVKSNLSGEFTQVNRGLVQELKSRGMWDRDMLDAIKYYDGALGDIDRVPEEVKAMFPTSFEVEPQWIIESASRRQKWIDMGMSLNLYLENPSGRKLHDMYLLAWRKGLKTTYYLRTLAATQVEKSTVDVNKFGIQPRWMKNKSASGDVALNRGASTDGIALSGAAIEKPAGENGASCSLDDPECEACQ